MNYIENISNARQLRNCKYHFAEKKSVKSRITEEKKISQTKSQNWRSLDAHSHKLRAHQIELHHVTHVNKTQTFVHAGKVNITCKLKVKVLLK